METGPRISQPEKATDYIEVEVLPPEGKAKQSNDPDPFIGFVSRLLDTFFVIPGTRIRFGLEPIIGLIPILGDQATSLMSAALLYRSARHRLPKIALIRMALNILINGVVEWCRALVIFLYSGTSQIFATIRSCNASPAKPLWPPAATGCLYLYLLAQLSF